MRPVFIHSPRYAVSIGDHVFPTRKFALAAEFLKGRGTFIEPELPSRDDLLLAHEPEWADKVSGAIPMTPADQTRAELPFSAEVSAAHRLAYAGTILACRRALEDGAGLHVGGGSHHAFSGHGEGFCLLNDIAGGILKMIAEKRLRRAAVVDLDVHQGNGTAAIFRGRSEVFTFSMHQEGIYPEIPAPGSLDVTLPAGYRDREYLKRLEEHLPRVFAAKPELVVYQAGVDSAEDDLLGGLKLTPAGLERRDRAVQDACRSVNVPAVVTLGGGYAADVRETARRHARTLLIFSGTGPSIS
ncbi:MAG TPA: histone deacetylase [Elusimicrobiota bacterium]|nr:histone deacetylase [Elusimicrobiota bacterium]